MKVITCDRHGRNECIYEVQDGMTGKELGAKLGAERIMCEVDGAVYTIAERMAGGEYAEVYAPCKNTINNC